MNCMENQIRYIDLGLVSKGTYTGIWEYQNVVNVQEPTLLKFSIEKKMSFSSVSILMI